MGANNHPDGQKSRRWADGSGSAPPAGAPPGEWAASRFIGEHKGRGMHILLSYGAAQAFPDWVFVCSREQISRAIPRLQQAGVEFALNDSLSKVTPAQARSVAALPGWRFPAQGRIYATDETAGQ